MLVLVFTKFCFFGFFMLYAILENSLRIFLVLRNKSETIVKGIVTSFEGFKLFSLNYICYFTLLICEWW